MSQQGRQYRRPLAIGLPHKRQRFGHFASSFRVLALQATEQNFTSRRLRLTNVLPHWSHVYVQQGRHCRSADLASSIA